MDNNKVVEVLRAIEDPASRTDIISARRISDLKLEGANVFFTLHTTGLNDSQKAQLNFKCQEQILSIYPDAQIHIHMKAAAHGSGADTPLPQVKNIIAVASGKGGVGKSTVSANLALGLAELGYRTALLDADLYGPSMPTMFGLKGQRPRIYEHYGKPVIEPLTQFGIHIMSIGFVVEPEQAVVLRGPRLSGVLKQFISDVRWPELDFMIVDLPPGTGDVQLSLVQSVPLTGAVLVTTPQEVALDDAIKAGNMFRIENINVPILGVVENMSWFSPEDMPEKKYYLFGQGGGKKLAQLFNTVLLAQLPLVQSVREAGDSGKPAVLSGNAIADIYKDTAGKLVRQTILRNEMLDPTRIVKMD